MRVAILHDYFGAVGGAEKLVMALARATGADVYTTDIDEPSLAKLQPAGVRLISLGFTARRPRVKQIQATWRFARADLRGRYDLFVLSGNWAIYAAPRHRPNLWYCHSPTRAFYDLYPQVIARQRTPLHRAVTAAWITTHRAWDRRAVAAVQRILVNSENTRRRVERIYRRPGRVVYPPVPHRAFAFARSGDFWLSVNRLYPEKRIDLQVEVFRRLPDQRLRIAGGYTPGDLAAENLAFLADLPPNVRWVGEVSEGELRRLYGECRGLICTALDEDFGMTPVEAMAAGKPVVAVAEGGYLETVADGVTGRLVEASVAGLVDAVRQVSADPLRYRAACEARASRFSEETFLALMREEMEAAQGRGAGARRRDRAVRTAETGR